MEPKVFFTISTRTCQWQLPCPVAAQFKLYNLLYFRSILILPRLLHSDLPNLFLPAGLRTSFLYYLLCLWTQHFVTCYSFVVKFFLTFRPTLYLDDHPLSVSRDFSFIISITNLHICRASVPS